jgi:predicted ATP-grasp superfamily ATP-dependent carboligase
LLLQQRIVGPGVGIFLLRWGGEPVATFAHRRIREKPPSGGVSVYRESIAADPKLVASSLALLSRFAWEGVAMVEYKLDAATGVPYLMEINGRFWGSLQLAVDAGVNFPGLLVSLALGEHPTPVTAYHVGVRSRWWLGDLDQLLARLRHSTRELALPPGSPGRARALTDFLTLWRPGDRNEIFRWSDPMPAVRETVEWMQGR